MARLISAQTLVWLREQPYEAGTTFAVVETPDLAASDPVEVDIGLADLWLRQGKAAAVYVGGGGAGGPGKPSKKGA